MTTTQPDLASGVERMYTGVLLRWTQYYLNEGCAVLAVIAGDKRPALGDWQVYQTRRPREDEVRTWFAGREDGALGIVTGAVSNNLVILDFDGDGWERARDELLRAFPDLRDSRRVETGNGRQHIWLRCEDLTGMTASLSPGARSPDLTWEKRRPSRCAPTATRPSRRPRCTLRADAIAFWVKPGRQSSPWPMRWRCWAG